MKESEFIVKVQLINRSFCVYDFYWISFSRHFKDLLLSGRFKSVQRYFDCPSSENISPVVFIKSFFVVPVLNTNETMRDLFAENWETTKWS